MIYFLLYYQKREQKKQDNGKYVSDIE